MEKYPEIEKLKNLYLAHAISIKQLTPANRDGFLSIEMTIRTKSWNLYVDNEYEDFNISKPLVALFLILFSLEMYKDSLDYLNWCKQNLLNASDLNWLEYYKSLEKTYADIKNELGEIDSCISSLDYQLRTSVIDALFNSEV